ncbi:MAG: rubrerythrin family protein [Planctomycetes bacterium]|nr:rubrerythrin family protein [Planctomycetota bacterium]
MATAENLQAAFAGESQANRKYLAFAKKAEADGFPGIARLFKAAAEAETVHAHAHLRVMDGVKTTAENLQAAIAGEAYEFKDMYPTFLAAAQKEGKKPAAKSFENALAVEKIHHALYSEAAESLKAGKDLAVASFFVCGICGNTVKGAAPDKCPVCGAPKARFAEVK